MAELVVRRLLIDLEAPFTHHWCGGDAFRSAFFNALSMSFPVGEQFFIDSVRNGFKLLPPEKQAEFQTEMRGFIGQEATHRRVHGLFNGHLERQGLTNAWGPRALSRLQRLEGRDRRHWLAITAANEHFTAILADWMLANPNWLAGSEARLQTMWLWHASEESEHKCTAFDLYQAAGGTLAWRRTWMRRVTWFFLSDTVRQTINNLRQDRTLWHWSTWKSAANFLFGKCGIVRHAYQPWRKYRLPDFHPSQQPTTLAQRWLQENMASYTPVDS